MERNNQIQLHHVILGALSVSTYVPILWTFFEGSCPPPPYLLVWWYPTEIWTLGCKNMNKLFETSSKVVFCLWINTTIICGVKDIMTFVPFNQQHWMGDKHLELYIANGCQPMTMLLCPKQLIPNKNSKYFLWKCASGIFAKFDFTFPRFPLVKQICSLGAHKIPLHDQSINWMLKLLYYHQVSTLKNSIRFPLDYIFH